MEAAAALLLSARMIYIIYLVLKYAVCSLLHSFYRATLRVSAVFAVPRVCCPSVTFVHCIQTVKDIVKLLSLPGSPNHSSLNPKRRYQIARGTPSTGALNTR